MGKVVIPGCIQAILMGCLKQEAHIIILNEMGGLTAIGMVCTY
jgi:hypothetical protein